MPAPPGLADQIEVLDERITAADLDPRLRGFASGVLRSLPAGDRLCHGDFHPGNFRGEAGSLVLLDWGDSGVGHPMLDMSAFLDQIPPAAVDRVRTHWLMAWRNEIPGADPERAAALLAPVASLRQALIYQVFLDGIEASEQPYHRDDPPLWLARTAHLVRDERAPLSGGQAGAV